MKKTWNKANEIKKPWEETNIMNSSGSKKETSTIREDDIVPKDTQKDDETTVAEAETLSTESAPQAGATKVNEDDIDEVL